MPIFDTLLSMLRRFLGRRSLFAADRGHIYHRLLERGLGHRQKQFLILAFALLLTSFSLSPFRSSRELLSRANGVSFDEGVREFTRQFAPVTSNEDPAMRMPTSMQDPGDQDSGSSVQKDERQRIAELILQINEQTERHVEAMRNPPQPDDNWLWRLINRNTSS